jgi:hypothetical protein
MRQGKSSIVKPRTSGHALPRIAIVALALLVAAPAAGASAADGSVAEIAKKKHKKKKKRKKARPVPSAPAAPPACIDDALEPDDSSASAFGLPFPGGAVTLARVRCPGDSDFYRVTIPAGAAFRFEVSPSNGLDAIVNLHGPTPVSFDDAGPNGTEYATYWNVSGSEPVIAFAEVTGAPSQQGNYSIKGYEVS